MAGTEQGGKAGKSIVTSIRLWEADRKIIRTIDKRLNIGQGDVMRLALRRLAEIEGVAQFARDYGFKE